MPDQPIWLQQVPAILDELRDFPAPVVDRFSVERLFGVSRRQAVRIMHRFGGYQVGRTFLITREELVARLEGVSNGPAADQVRNRKRRIWHELTEHRSRVKAMRVGIKGVGTASAPAAALAGLPEGVVLERARLEIQFAGPEDLLRKLYLLSQALAEDYDQFAELY